MPTEQLIAEYLSIILQNIRLLGILQNRWILLSSMEQIIIEYDQYFQGINFRVSAFIKTFRGINFPESRITNFHEYHIP